MGHGLQQAQAPRPHRWVEQGFEIINLSIFNFLDHFGRSSQCVFGMGSLTRARRRGQERAVVVSVGVVRSRCVPARWGLRDPGRVHGPILGRLADCQFPGFDVSTFRLLRSDS